MPRTVVVFWNVISAKISGRPGGWFLNSGISSLGVVFAVRKISWISTPTLYALPLSLRREVKVRIRYTRDVDAQLPAPEAEDRPFMTLVADDRNPDGFRYELSRKSSGIRKDSDSSKLGRGY